MKLKLIAAICLLSTPPAFAGDIKEALYGWTSRLGVHYRGVLGNEGGYQNLKTDSGNFINGKNCGGTNFGITCRDHPGVDVKSLTKDSAAKIYEKNEWAEIRGAEIKSPYISYKLLDLAVNMGSQTAVILLEKTINELNGTAADFPLTGRITAAQIKWVNEYTQDLTHRQLFVTTLKLHAMVRYLRIAKKRPALKGFLVTWGDRDILDE